MSFSINKKNYFIQARRGDSGSIFFEFNLPIDNYSVDFCIAKRTDTLNKNDIIISKCLKGSGNLLEVNLTAEETSKLKVGEGFFGQYYWSLKIHNEEGFMETLIPEKFGRTPKFLVYPKIGDCNNA